MKVTGKECLDDFSPARVSMNVDFVLSCLSVFSSIVTIINTTGTYVDVENV